MLTVVGESATGTAMSGMHGFAPALTSFVGRVAAVGELSGLLAGQRLVTVTGPGGAGKTRLAAEVARRVADQFADGVWVVELAAVRDSALVAAAIGAALGVRDMPGVPAARTLAMTLARRQLLLVLDNCEHVIDAAAQLCAALLTGCDDLRILATSREPLAVAGETRYRLGSLALPGPRDPAGDGESEAVRLFADRARLSDITFALDEPTARAVEQLVRRLDGMPLAIELAAARVEALGVAQLLDRIDDRFELLVSGDRLAAGRQRSLAATVEWSYQLLAKDEQRVFRLISAFPGPFTLAAAEAVAGRGAGPAVLRLVDCSLVVPPRAGPDGRARYAMLETLRGYGTSLLAGTAERHEADSAVARHALEVAEQATAGLRTTSAELAAAQWLDAEDATMRHVLAWAAGHDPDLALRLAMALAPWWFLRGRLASQYPLLRDAATHAASGSAVWYAAHFWLGWTAMYAADLAGALSHFTAVRDVIDGPGGAQIHGDDTQPASDQKPPPAVADCCYGLSVTLLNMGRIPEAAKEGQRALALAEAAGQPVAQAMALAALSIAAMTEGDLDGAVKLARRAGQVPADIPGWVSRARSNVVAGVLITAGDLAGAERVAAAAIASARDAGDLLNLAPLLTKMVRLDLRLGRAADAAGHLREALQINLRAGGRGDVLNGLDCCAYLCAATGRWADAVTVWAAYATVLRDEGYLENPAEEQRRLEVVREARRHLGAGPAEAAADRGAAMSRDIATEYALMIAALEAEPARAAPGRAPAGQDKLSSRERELVTLVARGRSDAEIAAELYISLRTVRSHLDRIRDKTGCRRRADLTRLALSSGLI